MLYLITSLTLLLFLAFALWSQNVSVWRPLSGQRKDVADEFEPEIGFTTIFIQTFPHLHDVKPSRADLPDEEDILTMVQETGMPYGFVKDHVEIQNALYLGDIDLEQYDVRQQQIHDRWSHEVDCQ